MATTLRFLLTVTILLGTMYWLSSPVPVIAQNGTTLNAGIGTATLDGVASAGEWPEQSITTTRGVTFKAMIDETNLYVLATWADETNSVAKDQWTWNGAGWDAAGDEDRIGIVWDMKDQAGNSLNGVDGASCQTMCHLPIMRTNFGRVDVWHFKANRFNPVGYTDDKYWDTCSDCDDGGRHGDSGSGSGSRNRNEARTGPSFMAVNDPGANVDFLADDQAVLDAFDPFGVMPGTVALKVDLDAGAQFAVGDTVPGRRLQIPTGNRASVRSAGKWESGMWTVEFHRKLAGEVSSDGLPEDFPVIPGGSVNFTSDVFDDLADHSQHPFSPAAGSNGADLTVYTLVFPNVTNLYFAQFGDGEGSSISSEIVLSNPGDQDANVKMSLKDGDGQPMTVDLNGEVVVGELEAVIPASGVRTFATDGVGELTVGSVLVEPNQAVSGLVVFGGSEGLAGVLSSLALTGFTAPMKTNTAAQIDSGIAVVNLEEEEVTLDLQLCDADGNVLATAQVNLPPMGQLPRFVTQFEWDVAVDFSDFVGLLKVSANGKKVAATVIQTRPGQFATMPVTPM